MEHTEVGIATSKKNEKKESEQNEISFSSTAGMENRPTAGRHTRTEMESEESKPPYVSPDMHVFLGRSRSSRVASSGADQRVQTCQSRLCGAPQESEKTKREHISLFLWLLPRCSHLSSCRVHGEKRTETSAPELEGANPPTRTPSHSEQSPLLLSSSSP